MDSCDVKLWHKVPCPICGRNISAAFIRDTPDFPECALVEMLCRDCGKSLALPIPYDTSADDALQIILEAFERKMKERIAK